MGREVRRVPLDFNWPLNKAWSGFINEYYEYRRECPFCEGSGQNPETKAISDDWYAFEDRSRQWCHSITQDEVEALIKEKRLSDLTHTWSKENGWQPKDPPYVPTADEVNEWSRKGFGHDAINCWICVETRAKRLGVWGHCEYCKGYGDLWLSPEYEKKYDAWEATDPPEGRGWQLWETVSEGSPITPVFATPEALAKWLSNDNNKYGEGLSYDTWLKFILDHGWAPFAPYEDTKIEENGDIGPDTHE